MKRPIESLLFFMLAVGILPGNAAEEAATLVLTTWVSTGNNVYEAACTWKGKSVTRQVYHDYNLPTAEESFRGDWTDIYRFLETEVPQDHYDLHYPLGVVNCLVRNGWTIVNDKEEELSDRGLYIAKDRRTVQVRPPSGETSTRTGPPLDDLADISIELQEIRSFEGGPKKREVRFNPRTGELAYLQGSSISDLILWKLDEEGSPRLSLKGGRAFAFDPIENRVAVADMGSKPVVYSLEKGVSEGTSLSDYDPSAPSFSDAIAFSPDGKTLAMGVSEFGSEGQRSSVRLLDAQSSSEIWRYDRPEPGSVTAIQFNPAGKSLAAAFASGTVGESTSEVRIFDLASGSVLHSLIGHWDVDEYFRGVHSLAYSRNGEFLATGGGDTTIRIWNPNTGEPITVLGNSGPIGHGSRVTGIDFSPDGSLLASASVDQHLILWDTASWKMIRRIELDSIVNSVTFSPDGALLAAACETGVKVWKIGRPK